MSYDIRTICKNCRNKKKRRGFLNIYIYIICKPLYNKHDRWKFTDAKRKKENKRGKKKKRKENRR